MEFQFCGAAGSVTGSKHYVACNEFQFLVDCGLVQERKNLFQNWEPVLENPSQLDAVFLTHAHLDHCGLLPKLVADGFQGKIYGTSATLELAKLVLFDSAHIQEEDAAFKKKRHAKEGRVPPRPVRPLYTQADVEKTVQLFCSVPYSGTTKVAPGVEVVYRDAGHILGSAFIEVILTKPQVDQDEPRRILFSGDLGRANRPIVCDPEFYTEPNVISNLFIESTYGDRESEPIETVNDQLIEVVNRTLDRGGKVIMPVFAVERAQEMLVRFAKLIVEGKIPADTPIFLDSPMAVEATLIFNRHREIFNEETIEISREAKDTIKNLHLFKTQQESRTLNEMEGPAVIMSSAGMCNAGRIKHHLVNHIGDPRNTVAFLGYQAEGTLGKLILNGVNPVRIHGQPRQVNAEIVMIRGISGHADQSELLEWYSAIPIHPKTTFVVHGEQRAIQTLAEKIKEIAPETYVLTPEYKEIYKD